MPISNHPDVIDYTRSFIQGLWPYNEVRLAVESRTRFVDEARGVVEDYYQCAACKSEYTFAKEELFQPDNFNFTPVFGPELGIIFRRRAWLNPNYKSVQPVNQMWQGPTYDGVRKARSCRELMLDDPGAVAEAAASFAPIVAQTEIVSEKTRQRVIYEYPVKTLNINREKGLYQTDTGPMAFVDLSNRVTRVVDNISLAYCAFNAPGFADFILEEPTRVGGGADADIGPSIVYHYSRRVSLAAKNRLYVLGD